MPFSAGPGVVISFWLHSELLRFTVCLRSLFEIKEAFASQSVAVVRDLGLPNEKVNVNGGAIALGHPVGATGAILVVKLMNELKRRGAKYGVVTMCIGGGQGIATVFQNLQS